MGHRPGAGARPPSGAVAYSYYFLPPAGFGIENPEDRIAFITFIVTAVIAGELASRAERRAAEAQAGRKEIERLCQELQAAFERASEAELGLDRADTSHIVSIGQGVRQGSATSRLRWRATAA